MNKWTSLLLTALLGGALSTTAVAENDEGGWQSGQTGEGQDTRFQPDGAAAALDRSRLTAGTDFNPAISVILDGVYRNDFSGEVEDPPGFGGGHGHGHGHGHGVDEGMQLREAEVTFSGSVDNYLDAMAVLAVDEGGEVEIEEAFIQTRSLPAGLQLKAGRFLSDIGYINRQHIHDWDFVDRPLVSEMIFGDEGLRETGIQTTWLAPLPFYNQYGIEVLEGNNDGVASHVGDQRHEEVVNVPVDGNGDFDLDGDPERVRWRDHNGLEDTSTPRLFTAFTKFGPDLGFSHAAQFGFSGGYATSWQDQEAHSSTRLETWDGDAWFAGLDAVYKYDAGRSYGHGNWTVQGEYFYREIDVDYRSQVFEDGSLVLSQSGNDPDEFSGTGKQDGFYLQTLYGFAPRWNVGLRAEAVGLTNESLEADRDENRFEEFDTTYRYSGQVRFMPTEFSILRAQVNYKDLPDHDGHDHDAWSFMLQYNVSLGKHGAHEF